MFRAWEKENLAVRTFIKSTCGIGNIAVFRGNLNEPGRRALCAYHRYERRAIHSH